MSKKYQNGFFIFGLTVLIIMVTQLDFAQVWSGLKHAGYWFFAVVGLWAVLYVFNTCSWFLIIKGVCQQSAHDAHQPTVDTRHPVSLPWLYKVTVSGFALNYATPGGLMGGEPYRIMELAPRIGTERASSSVILYVMTHIFSHFWFWLLSVGIYLITQSPTMPIAVILALTTAFCMLGIWFFMRGYKKGLAMMLTRWLSKMPWMGKWARRLMEKQGDKLREIDTQIAALHKQNPVSFVSAVVLELLCRFLSSFEIMFVLLVIMPEVSYPSCVIILAFTSLFANLLFFIPLQLGGREGGFMLSASGLAMAASSGIFVALIVRIRELIWTAIGLMLIKMERTKK